jgi:predicted CXXCH cytochrome family protein
MGSFRCFSVLALLLVGLFTARAQQNDECLACHSDKSLSMVKKGRTISLHVDGEIFGASAHGALECVSCHEGYVAGNLPHAAKPKAVSCVGCHEDAAKSATSIHGTKGVNGRPAAVCVDCHTAHAVKKFSELSPADHVRLSVAVCSRCHEPEQQRFAASDHGLAVAAGVTGAPTCTSCHSEHDVRSSADTTAQTSRMRQAAMCLKCHLDDPSVRERVGPASGFIAGYEKSVHGIAVQRGDVAAAVCSDCHGSHDMRKGSNPESKVARTNIAATCGQCHPDIQEQYTHSIHGQALARGVTASATCTDCHGEHSILAHTNPDSPIASQNISAQVCSPCHASVRLTAKYGLAADRFKSYADSYHGLANQAGNVQVANCASCHGVHDIKPSSDSTSRISPGNLAKTCGKCHPGANENFTRGSVHIVGSTGNDRILYLVATGYVILIALTIGGMVFHNLLDFIKKARKQLLVRRGIITRTHTSHRLYLRMSLSERVQHGALVLSFATLVLTGFALKYPDAWWVWPIRSISPFMFELRGIIHRIAAVIMVLASLYHLYYIFFVPRGKQLLRDLLPVKSDLTDALHVMQYNLGFTRTKPLFGRFSYVEKAEYWALIWGTLVMTATGVILWFDNTFLGILTKVGWDVARTVHYYEAWLATLSIIVWHLYFVIFNPDTYPINLAFWKGTITEEEMHEEHPLELEKIKKDEAAENTPS